MIRWFWHWGPALAQMAVIFGYSSLSHPTVPLGVSDDTGHFAGYALLGALVFRAFARARWSGISSRSALSALVFSSAYGASDEFHQHFVPNRTPDAVDWLADTAGAATAIAVILVAAAILRRRTPRARAV
jgi:VanZ family protein